LIFASGWSLAKTRTSLGGIMRAISVSRMNTIGNLRAARWLVLLTMLGTSLVRGNEVSVARTNWVERWITNLIEVQVPANHFVNRYHTNQVERFWTNVVEVYSTNHVTKVVTNRVAVDAFHTNFVQAYQTNFKTLHLTNWNSVLVLRTNWVTQPVTNVVDLDLPAKASDKSKLHVGNQTMNPVDPVAQTAALAAERRSSEPLAIAANKTPRLLPNNQIEVKLIVHWTNDTTAPVQVQQWRIERDDGTILCFGQDQEFKRGLPAGKYKVKVKAQREMNGPLLAALGTLAVTPSEVVLQQKPTVTN
jgi:hypothetical protein